MNIWDKLKTGRGILLLVAAAIILIAAVWAMVGKTAGEIADLTLSPASINTTAGSNFNLTVSLDSKTNNIVAVKAVVNYNISDFELININTDSSVFAANNTCVHNGRPCEIITEDPANGRAIITLSKPSPGVSTASGTLAVLTFKALRAVQPSAENITLHYIAFGSYDDSDVILDGIGDDGEGSDILNNVVNTTVSAALPTPTNFAATASSATQADLSWTDAFGSDVGITGYRIYRDGSEIGTTAGTTYQDSGLAPLTAYNYQVSAYNSGGSESTLTSQAPVITLADTDAPTVPANLNASASAMDIIDLSWTASTDNVAVTGYRIYRDGSEIDTTAGVTYQDTGLTPSTAYSYTVLAYDEAGNNSAQSAADSATTSADSEDPTVPTNLTATAVSISQINLSWTASTDNVAVTGYRIYRNGSEIDTTTAVNYQDTGLAISTEYTYTILAYDAEGNESAQSSSASATTNDDTESPTTPTNLTATPVSMTQIDLSWTASTDNIGVTGYRVYRDSVLIGTSTSTTYQDTGREHATEYTYYIRAYDAAGNLSPQSSSVSATTLSDSEAPTVPAGLTATPASMTQIDLSWTASTDNIEVTGYRIYRDGAEVAAIPGATYQDTGLTESTEYVYTVLAYDAAGNSSAQSSPVTVTTLAKTYTLSDFTNLVRDWLQTSPPSSDEADVNNDGVINTRDMGIMMSNWED